MAILKNQCTLPMAMVGNKPADTSDIGSAPVKPEALKEKLYSALVEQQGYSISNEPRIPGYHDCVAKEGIEISGVTMPLDQRVRVDMSLLVLAPADKDFGETYCGGLSCLSPRKQIYVTQDNLTGVLQSLAYFAEKGKIIIDSNPDKRI